MEGDEAHSFKLYNEHTKLALISLDCFLLQSSTTWKWEATKSWIAVSDGKRPMMRCRAVFSWLSTDQFSLIRMASSDC